MSGITSTIGMSDTDFTSIQATGLGGAFYSLATGTTTVTINAVKFATATATSGAIAYMVDSGAGNLQLTSSSLTASSISATSGNGGMFYCRFDSTSTQSKMHFTTISVASS